MTRYKSVHNPLPPPPQPLPLDRFPGLGRYPISEERSTTPATGTATNGNTSRPTTGTGRHADTSRSLGANGSAHTHAMMIPSSSVTAAEQVQLSMSTDSKKSMGDHRSRTGEEDGRMAVNGEGSNRHRQYPDTSNAAELDPRKSVQSSQRQHHPQNHYSYVQSEFLGSNGLPHTAPPTHHQTTQQTSNSRARIVPGASPTHWVIPPPLPLPPLPRYLYGDVHPHAETDWETEERPRDRHNRRHRTHDRRRSKDEPSSSGLARGMPMSSASDGEVDDVETRLVSASAFVAGYGSGYDEGLGYSSIYSRGGYVPAVQSDNSTPRSISSEHGVGGLGLIGIPGDSVITGTVIQASSNGPADVTTPRARPTQSHPNNDMITAWRTANQLTTGGLQDGSRQTVEQAEAGPSRVVRSRGTNVEEVRRENISLHALKSVNGSVSSWGTVNTSARGSMSDLGLIGLHRGGVTGQGSVAEDSQFTPMIGTNSDINGDGTPRMGRADFPLGFVTEPRTTHPQGYSSDSERPRQLRSLSRPELPAAVDEDLDRHNIRQDELSIRPHYSRRHTLAQSISLDSGTYPPSAYRSQTDVNALALTFDASLSTNNSTQFAADTRGDSPEHIRAPAPRVGGPNVINLWRSGA